MQRSCNRPDVRLYHNRSGCPLLRSRGQVLMQGYIVESDEKQGIMEKQNNNRTRWLHIRLKPVEYEKIFRKFSKSTCRKLSDYARRHLLDKTAEWKYRNQSMDELMAETIRLKKELNGIGNNFNQVVKKLHTLQQIGEFRNWLIGYEFERKILFNKIEEVKNHILKVSEKWLQS